MIILGNALSPFRRQAVSRIGDDLLWNEALRVTFFEFFLSKSSKKLLLLCLAVWPFNSSPTGHHFSDDALGCIFVTGTFCIIIKTPLKFVPKVPTDNNPALA